VRRFFSVAFLLSVLLWVSNGSMASDGRGNATQHSKQRKQSNILEKPHLGFPSWETTITKPELLAGRLLIFDFPSVCFLRLPSSPTWKKTSLTVPLPSIHTPCKPEPSLTARFLFPTFLLPPPSSLPSTSPLSQSPLRHEPEFRPSNLPNGLHNRSSSPHSPLPSQVHRWRRRQHQR